MKNERAAGLRLYAMVETQPSRAVRGVELVRAAGVWIVAGRGPVLEPTIEAAVEHDRIVRAVARSCDAVLPLRFGMTAESASALAKKLAPFRGVVRDAFDRVRGAVQITMRVEGRELRADARARAAARGDGPGARFLGRKAAAEQVPEIAALTEALAPYVRDTRIERRPVGESFASVFFLVPREKLAGWRRVVRATTIPDVTWHVTGPWPPYAFAELV